MLILSNDVLKIFSNYLSGAASIAEFRDYMAGLRVDKYKLLADADRLFLNEFEGRFAEFSDLGGDEALLKANLVSFVQAEASNQVSASAYVWSFPSKQSSESSSSNDSSKPSETFNDSAAYAHA
jgi:hypothetical protein